MSHDVRVQPRVMLGDLGPVTRVGMRDLAGERGATVVGEHDGPDAVVRSARQQQPDLVVLPLEGSGSRLLAARVRAAAPAARLVLLARDESVVELQEQGSNVRRRVLTSAVEAMDNALRKLPRRSPIEGEQCPTT